MTSSAMASNTCHDLLSTTVLGGLQPGQSSQLAVHWTGKQPTILDVWLESEGEHNTTPSARLVSQKTVQPGINILELELPADIAQSSAIRTKVVEAKMGQAPSESQSCEVVWSSGFDSNGLNGSVLATAVWDDGEGEALYVGGNFNGVDDVPINHIARWDGSSWSPLGSGVSGIVMALTVFDDGNGGGPALYVGGFFGEAGDSTARNITRWDGSTWAPLGVGVSGSVRALTVFDDGLGEGPALYAGGRFSHAGGSSSAHIARWDGSSWAALSSSIDGDVNALTEFDDGDGPALYAGGSFAHAGGGTAYNIARWDGSNWSSLGTGVTNPVNALTVFNDGDVPALYVGGYFTESGSISANHIARWDGSNWFALSDSDDDGNGVDKNVFALTVYDGELYVGGSFNRAGGLEARYFTRWDGNNWFALNDSSGNGVGGEDDRVYTLAVFESVLYVGGNFEQVGGVAANNIARWDGNNWSTLGNGDNNGAGIAPYSEVKALTVYEGDLYVGGNFDQAGGLAATNIARWDGSNWFALGDDDSNGAGSSRYTEVKALTIYDGDLYVGGFFSQASGVAVRNIARWDGSNWSALINSDDDGNGVDNNVFALTVYDGELYVGGSFNRAGGADASGIARWDGNNWYALGSGISLSVYALTTYDDGLYVGGDFSWAGGVAANNIAHWDGSNWSGLSDSGGNGVDDNWSGAVYALTVFDDNLYVGGRFDQAGGVIANNITRWDGDNWYAMETAGSNGLDGEALALLSFNGELYAGGLFRTAGGIVSNHIAKANVSQCSNKPIFTDSFEALLVLNSFN